MYCQHHKTSRVSDVLTTATTGFVNLVNLFCFQLICHYESIYCQHSTIIYRFVTLAFLDFIHDVSCYDDIQIILAFSFLRSSSFCNK